MADAPTLWLAVVNDVAAAPSGVQAALTHLLTEDPALGRAAALDVLAREPRVKPSRALVIDPDDRARRRWAQRVAAGVALLESPAGAGVFAELLDELADSPELAEDVLATAEPNPALGVGERRALDALRRG